MGNLATRILKLRELTTPYSAEELERLFTEWREGYIEVNKEQDIANRMYEEFNIRHANDDYFKLKHITEIDPGADIYICLTKRNTGKTYSYMKLISDLVEQGEEFAIVRNSQGELKTAIKQQFRDYAFMFKDEMVVKGFGVYKRRRYEEVVGKKVVEKTEDTLVGHLAYLSGKTQAFQGSSYPKVKTIIWDEATNAGKTSKETNMWNYAFWQLVITFFRGKEGCKMFIFGNLMSYADKDDNLRTSDQLIRDLGIDPEDNLKLIRRTNRDSKGNLQEVKILYINTRDLYNTWGLTVTNIFVDKTKSKALQYNRPVTSGKNIVGEIMFIQAEDKEFGICCRYANKYYVIQIASVPDIEINEYEMKNLKDGVPSNDRFYVIRIVPLNRGLLGFGMPIYTDDSVAFSTYGDVLTLSKKMDKCWYVLDRILKSGKVVYVGDSSQLDMAMLRSNNEHYIQEYKNARGIGGGNKRTGKVRKRKI